MHEAAFIDFLIESFTQQGGFIVAHRILYFTAQFGTYYNIETILALGKIIWYYMKKL